MIGKPVVQVLAPAVNFGVASSRCLRRRRAFPWSPEVRWAAWNRRCLLRSARRPTIRQV